MTCAWAIEVEEGVYVRGHGGVPTGTGKVSSTRAERRGRAAILTNITQIAIQHNIQKGAIKTHRTKKNRKKPLPQEKPISQAPVQK